MEAGIELDDLTPEVARLLTPEERKNYRILRRAAAQGKTTAPFVCYLKHDSAFVSHESQETDICTESATQRGLDPLNTLILKEAIERDPAKAAALLESIEPQQAEWMATLSEFERKVWMLRIEFPKMSQREIAARLSAGGQRVSREQVKRILAKGRKLRKTFQPTMH